jgi:chaperonin cofactor prefoldin
MTITVDQLIQIIGLVVLIGGGIVSVIMVYVNLTNKITRLETKVETHEKKHDTTDTTLKEINTKLDEMKAMLIDEIKRA